jgi:hypothetical protein
MIYTLEIELEVVNDLVVRAGLKKNVLAAPIAVAVLGIVSEQLKLQQLVAALGGPRRHGSIELPGNGPLPR